MKLGTLSSILMVVVLALALAFASSLEPTGVGLIALSLIPVLVTGAFVPCREKRSLLLGLLVGVSGVYAAWVASRSPVIDFGRTDGLLLGCGLAACCWAGWMATRSGVRFLFGGIGILAMANVIVALIQWKDPAFTPFYAGRETDAYPSGFYAHYNHFANFLLGAGFVTAGCALLPGSGRWARIGWLVVAISCAGGIVLSQSRGAVLGAGVGCIVLLCCWLLDLHRRRVRWFGIALVSALAILPLAGWGAWKVARHALASRGLESNEARIVDDSGRLDFAAIAVQLATEHPLTGGGSRSFSYEVFRKWNAMEMWVGSGDIDMVHNELLQAAADYGWIGMGLVILLVFLVASRGLMVIAVEPSARSVPVDGAVTAGALAGITAMMVQSLFSFVFHMAPDVLLLALLLGAVISQPWPFVKEHGLPSVWHRPAPWIGCTLAVVLGIVAWRDVGAWWLAARPGAPGVSRDPEIRYHALGDALKIRPDFRIELSMAETAGLLAQAGPDPVRAGWSEQLMEHQRSILARHPWQYATRLGLARQLDELGQFREAEEHYRQLLPLLDTREMYYHARFSYGSHAFRRAYALWQARRPSDALAWAMEARSQMEISRKNAVFGPGSPQQEELQRVIDFIAWLEKAQVKPQDGIVPELK